MLRIQCISADLMLGLWMPQEGHLNLACPAAPPRRSARPAFPPPLFVVAAATFPAISFAVCFFGFAFPPMSAAFVAGSVD